MLDRNTLFSPDGIPKPRIEKARRVAQQKASDRRAAHRQRATAPDGEGLQAPHPTATTARAESAGHPAQGHWAAGACGSYAGASATVQEIWLRSEEELVKAGYLRDRANGVFACWDIARHMQKSLPHGCKASASIVKRFWWRVHFAVATTALRQVQREVRRLGLTHVPDTRGFVQEKCAWYVRFCAVCEWFKKDKA
jgi:hypothetical protein